MRDNRDEYPPEYDDEQCSPEQLTDTQVREACEMITDLLLSLPCERYVQTMVAAAALLVVAGSQEIADEVLDRLSAATKAEKRGN